MREENVFGVPLTVGTPEELLASTAGQATIHIIVRCVDAANDPVYPALAARRRRTICEGCREVCWYDPASIVDAAATLLCRQCVAARPDVDPGGGLVTDAIFTELRRNLLG